MIISVNKAYTSHINYHAYAAYTQVLLWARGSVAHYIWARGSVAHM